MMNSMFDWLLNLVKTFDTCEIRIADCYLILKNKESTIFIAKHSNITVENPPVIPTFGNIYRVSPKQFQLIIQAFEAKLQFNATLNKILEE